MEKNLQTSVIFSHVSGHHSNMRMGGAGKNWEKYGMAELFKVETLLAGQFVIDLSVINLTSILHVLLTS